MHTKETLIQQLKDLGIKPDDTVMMHSSFKSMGEVEGGPDTVLDALSEYLKDGLLVLPTHTWAQVNAENPRYYVEDTPSNVGILTELFRQRDGVARSLHPTHSVGALGKDAEEFVEGDEKFETPCARDSSYGKLLDREAKILLVGVDLVRNTFIHGVEEWVDIPGRLTDGHEQLYTVLPDGTEILVPSQRHTPFSWSMNFWKVDEVLQEQGAMFVDKFGDADVRVCDTVKLTEVLNEMLEAFPGLFDDKLPLTTEQRNFFR